MAGGCRGYRPVDICPSTGEISPGDRRTRGKQRIAGMLSRRLQALPTFPLVA
jgi:hypothetical protein